jgi:uncharacterized protein DUF6929
MQATEQRSAIDDPSLHATLLERTPLLYTAGASAQLDRPAHVRSGSSLHPHGGAFVLVQDDANFIALVRPDSWDVHAWTLPAGANARRQFDDVRGNKAEKLDLEAAIILPPDQLLAFGSGSSERRENVVMLALDADDAAPLIVPAPGLYAALRAESRFAGSELNIEGAARMADVVRFFNRGNGAARGTSQPFNATVDLDVSELLRHVLDPAQTPVPSLRNLQQYELGRIEGHALSFTDAATIADVLLFVATAELSPDSTRDGPVSGSVIGVMTDQIVRWTPLRDRSGAVVPVKVEGIAATTERDRVFVVIDHDDPHQPAELGVVALSGSWW